MTERHHAPGAEERLSEEAEKAARIVREDAAAAEAVAEREVREAECRAKEGLVEGVSSARHELEMDRAAAGQSARREEADLRRAAELLTHPEALREGAAAAVARETAKVERLADDLAHPSRELEAAKQAVEHRREAIEEVGQRIVSETEGPSDKKKLPLAMKVLGVLCLVAGVYNLAGVVWGVLEAWRLFQPESIETLGISTLVVQIAMTTDYALLLASFAFFGLRLLRNRRRLAALTLDLILILLVVGVLCSVMLQGIGYYLIGYGVLLVFAVAMQSYLDPSLAEERELRRKLRDMDLRDEAEAGTLGLDETGRGFITLNFFNLFWIFVVCSVLGLGIETVYHFLVVDPGQYQDRAGLLFGPFSPIYGIGAVLMTVFLNRFHKKNVVLIFFVSAVIGGAFEYFTSVFMQYAFGAVAWDYTGMWLSIGGRTCGLFMIMWGVLGVVWIKLLLPVMLRIVNLIPWNWRYAVTTVCAALMLADAIMTLQSLDCWYERLSGNQVDTPIQSFYDRHFDNAYMEHRFQSMSIHPDDAVRGGK